MAKLNSFIVLISLFFSVHARAAAVKIKSLNYTEGRNQGTISIKLNKQLDQLPELLVRDRMIQISVPGSFVWPKIEKSISIQKEFDSKITAYQFDKGNVRIRTMLPYDVKSIENDISLEVIGSSIVMTFPKKGRSFVKKANKAKKPGYDDSYLEKLLKDQGSEDSDDIAALMAKKIKSGNSKNSATDIKDEISVAMSAPVKEVNSGFSMMNYVAKFAGFLALVLLFFYGLVTFLKKGAMKKGRLGFLNNTKIVEVISTTHVGPKKNLLLVRAHDQVFLVSNTDQGMSLISEVNDINGLIKEGEKRISGSNFDSELDNADKADKTFNTKDILNLAAARSESGNDQERPVEDKVRLSDQIKNKVKGLKSLQ